MRFGERVYLSSMGFVVLIMLFALALSACTPALNSWSGFIPVSQHNYMGYYGYGITYSQEEYLRTLGGHDAYLLYLMRR